MDEQGRIGQAPEDRRDGGRWRAGLARARSGRGGAGSAARRCSDPSGAGQGVVGVAGRPGATARSSRSRAARRRPHGPRPVRPAVARVVPAVRPACLVVRPRAGQRLLARPSLVAASGHPLRVRVRRALAAAAVVLAAAAVVVVLGLLAGAAAAARGGGQQPPAATETVTVVTVGTGETVWDLARQVTPAASGAELAAVVERIVTGNSLASVQLHPGQVLQVPLR